jgi:hypothetical protein
MYSLKRFFAGIDVGGSHISFAVVDVLRGGGGYR